MLSINLAIMLPFIMAIFIPFLHKRASHIHIGWFLLAVPAVLFTLFARFIPAIARGDTFTYTLKWIPSLGINFTTYVDGLSIIFGLLITGIGSLVILYSIYYLSTEESLQHFYTYLLLFMGAMLGVVFSDNMMVLYVFWELTSISSFLLIAFWYHRKMSRYGAQKSLLITVSGGIAMLTGFIMLYLMTGTFSIREIIFSISQIADHPFFLPAMLLLLLGAFTKSAQFPFHIWLPDAMEAPTPVSAYLHSATMVKAGIYIVARFTPVFGGTEVWFWSVTGIGLLTLLWCSFLAVRQTDLKALLAYSTVSQLGLIMSLFGIGSIAYFFGMSVESTLFTQATFAALFHLVNHSTFKGALFMIVGIVDHELGTRDIRRLGGLMAFMPISFTVAMIGSFSMAGLPPFNGFLSKEMFFTAVLNISELEIFSLSTWGIFVPIIAWVASLFTFIYSMIILFKTFFGPYEQEKLGLKKTEIKEAPLGMLIAPLILASLVVGIFFFPNLLGTYLLRPALVAIFPTFVTVTDSGYDISIWHGFNREIIMTIAIVVVGIFLYRLRNRWKDLYTYLPSRWSFNTLYNWLLTALENGSAKVTKSYMTGFLRDYLVYIYLFFVVSVGGTLLWTGAFSFTLVNDAPITLYEWLLILVILAASIAILFAQSRLSAIIFNGVVGFSVAFFFVLFRAPDLALTQIVVETVTTVLFLLCFYFLPEWKKESAPPKTKRFNLIISISVGVLFTLIALAVNSGKLFETIASYFENAEELTGGRNIVNTILGDFRAFDTMLEVIVLFIAGIGVYTLIKLRSGKGAARLED